MQKLLETGKTLRGQLASYNVASNAKPTVAIRSTSDSTFQMFNAEKDVI